MIEPISLGRMALFSDFPPNDLEVLAGTMREREFQEGETIVQQDERGRNAFVILHGSVRVERRVPFTNTFATISVLSRGAMFGILSVLDGKPRMASCLAASYAVVAEIAADDFQRLMGSTTPLGTRFQLVVARTLIRDLRRTNQRIAELAALETLEPALLVEGIGSPG